MKELVAVLIFAVATDIINSQVTQGLPPLQPNFNPAKYAGRWYQIYRPANFSFEKGTDTYFDYRWLRNGTLSYAHNEWLPDQNKWSTTKTFSRMVNSNEPAQWAVRFPIGNGNFIDDDYRVLYTDYNTVSVVLSEMAFGGRYFKNGFILARQKVLPQLVEDMAVAILGSRGIERTRLNKTIHGVAGRNVYLSPVVVVPTQTWYGPVQWSWPTYYRF